MIGAEQIMNSDNSANKSSSVIVVLFSYVCCCNREIKRTNLFEGWELVGEPGIIIVVGCGPFLKYFSPEF